MLRRMRFSGNCITHVQVIPFLFIFEDFVHTLFFFFCFGGNSSFFRFDGISAFLTLNRTNGNQLLFSSECVSLRCVEVVQVIRSRTFVWIENLSRSIELILNVNSVSFVNWKLETAKGIYKIV